MHFEVGRPVLPDNPLDQLIDMDWSGAFREGSGYHELPVVRLGGIEPKRANQVKILVSA